MQSEGNYHYNVLFVRTEKQSEIADVLSASFPKERGKVILPMWEYWRRDRKEIAQKPLFPGYIFMRTDMGVDELHTYLKTFRYQLSAYIRQLGFEKERAAREETDEEDIQAFKLLDLTEEESHYLDLMLDEEGVERMSYGYCDPRVVVMEGPLVTFADRIIKRDKHERIAWLDVSFRNIAIKAGLTIRPKEDYFPKEDKAAQRKQDPTGEGKDPPEKDGKFIIGESKNSPEKDGKCIAGESENSLEKDRNHIGNESKDLLKDKDTDHTEVLEDGTRVDLQELTRKMTDGQTVYRTRR